MPYSFIICAFLTVGAFCLVGVAASGKVKNASDYAVAGRKATAFPIAGIIMGALVAGGSTIGTVQLAYEWGLSAWWFTLGSGIGCAVLGLRFAAPMRRLGLTTLPELIENNYGHPTALLTMASSILGTTLSIVTQFLAGTALLRSVVPLSPEWATALLAIMILAFIFSGGLKSYSAVGSAKTLLLYALLILCCIQAMRMGQTPARLFHDLPFSPWFNPVGRDPGKDIGAGVSLVVGILCTQIYLQAVFAASDERTARRGCCLAAVLIPPLGLMAIWVGLALRNAGVEIEPAQALPYFLMTRFPPALSGFLWAGLAITIVGGAAGLCLGVATNISTDIYRRITKCEAGDSKILYVSRAAVVLTVLASALIGLKAKTTYILQLSYIGMGLRGAGVVLLVAAAILRPGRISPHTAFLSALMGLCGMLAAWILLPGIEPLFVGLALAALPLLPALLQSKP